MLVEKLIELKVGRSVDVHLLRRCRWTSRITMAAWHGELLSKPLQGLSPLDICVQKKHQDAGEVLVSAGAKLVKDGSVRGRKGMRRLRHADLSRLLEALIQRGRAEEATHFACCRGRWPSFPLQPLGTRHFSNSWPLSY